MRVQSGLRMIPVSLLGLLAWSVEGQAGFDYDSRHVYDICSPDQIETVEGVKVEWGHYRQWQTVNGTLSGPGSCFGRRSIRHRTAVGTGTTDQGQRL